MSPPLRPLFKGGPITRLDTLARVLGASPEHIQSVAVNAASHYKAIEIAKKDGAVRICWDPSTELRALQKKLVLQILRPVQYPEYLHGSLPGRDYVSNAKQHRHARWSVGLDIKSFFPNVSSELVSAAIWKQFFRCSDEVAEVLTSLTTLNGFLPQGSLTASYLANLALWRDEPRFVADLSERGFRYTRYVDDITISSAAYPVQHLKTWVFHGVQTMLRANGLRQKRAKTEIRTRGSGINVVGLRVEQRVGRSRKSREILEDAVIELSGDVLAMPQDIALRHARSLKGRITELARHHPRAAAHLQSLLELQLTRLGIQV